MKRHELVILGTRGDTRVGWDLDEAEGVKEAERIFNEHRARGFAAFRVGTVDSADTVQIHQFDPEAERILQFPPIAGG